MWSWLRRKPPAVAGPQRWLVLDVESSGLDADRDSLLAVAAVAVHVVQGRPSVVLADSFEAVLRQAPPTAGPDRQNILVHGIGLGEQARGMEAGDALARFEAFVGSAPLIGFHVAFDRRLIERAARAAFGRSVAHVWLDLAELAPVLQPTMAARSLDEWLQALGIDCLHRHRAAADALSTAELLLRLWPAARAEGAEDFRGLARLAARRRWLR